MRSPTSRVVLEWTARVIAVAAVILLLLRALAPATDARAVSATDDELGDALREWTRETRDLDISVTLGEVPGREERHWLRAIARAGSRVRWSGELTPLVVAAAATAEPSPSHVIRVIAGDRRRVAVADELGSIATVGNGERISVVRAPAVASTVLVAAERGVATTPLMRPPLVRAVAVLGDAAWETKFIVRALEEHGWRVHPRFHVAPGITVGDFSAGALDTARYSAVVVVGDAIAPAAEAVARFARSGGGVVLAARAATHGGATQFTPVASARRLAPRNAAVVTPATLGGLQFTALRPGAVPVQRQGDAATVAAVRVGAGRVVAVGYDDTWRWRMQGSADAPSQHRAWWSSIVGSVALARDTVIVLGGGDPAPLAALHDELGTPAGSTRVAVARALPWDATLYVLLVVALLGEIISRRRRGEV